MSKIKVKKLEYNDIKQYKSQVEKESVDLKDNGTNYIGLYVDGELAGFVGFKRIGNIIRYKTDYLFKKYRGKGYYRVLFRKRDEICKGFEATAFCTEMSIKTFKKNGFKIESKNKNGFYFVRRKKNEKL